MRFVHVYEMSRDARVPTVAPLHASYWDDLGLVGYLGGPYGDRSGGVITFEVDSYEAAKRLVSRDPFVQEGLLASSTLKEWIVE